MEEKLLSHDQMILFILLVRIGVIAALATLLIRTQLIKNLLFFDNRGRSGYFLLTAIFSGLLGLGVIFRLLLGYHATDLSLCGTLATGLLLGPFYGALTGIIVSIPAIVNGEILAFPFGILCGFSAGILRYRFKNKEAIWEFSPFQYFNTIQLARQTDWKTALLNPKTHIMFLCILLEMSRMIVSYKYGSEKLFALLPSNIGVIFCVFIGTIICVGVPTKIWNNTRLEIILKENEKQLLKSRYEVLKSQINPHFLFNTLNSISSLIRTDPDKAREIIIKLSNVLRTLLKEKRDLVSVKEEMDLIDTYLIIEKSRFGEDRLVINKKIDPQADEILIPGMMLQPIVENAIKHGISKKIGGGTISIKIEKKEDSLICEIADNGVGTSLSHEKDILERGIGLNNIKERLKVFYGDRFSFDITSEKDAGTNVRISIFSLKPTTQVITDL